MFDPLVAVRALHFAATALTAGATMFELVIAAPTLRSGEASLIMLRIHIAWLVYGGLATASLSGLGWFLLFTAQLAGHAVADVLTDDTGFLVLTQTRFGAVWALRLGCAALLAVCYAMRDRRWAAPAVLASSTVLLGALAWVGHSGAAPGIAGSIQLAADVLHLIAAAGWIGALVPLAILFTQTGITGPPVYDITRRFSTFGVINVATLAVTGVVNTYFLVGSLDRLVATAYGQILLVKIGLFAAMLALAAINRLRHVPRLDADERGTTVRNLQRNSIAEIVLGTGVLLVVGLLGTIVPAAHELSHTHIH